MKMQIQLTDAEFQKLAEETRVSSFDLQKIYSMGLMRDPAILNFLIRHDFKMVKRMGKYRSSQFFFGQFAINRTAAPRRVG